MADDGYTILHRKDERGVIVESGTFGPDDEIPEGFGSAEYQPVYAPREDDQEPVAESALTSWESPIAKGTWVEQDNDAVAEALSDVEDDEEPVVDDPELDEGSPRQAREQSEDGELTGAEEEVDESLESDEDDSDDEAESEVDEGTPRQAREQSEDGDLTDAEQEQDESAEAGDSTAPPQGGPGSGKEAWAQYAAAKNVSVPEDASRDEIVAAVKKAGHPV